MVLAWDRTKRIDAKTIDELIESSGPRVDALRRGDARIAAAALKLPRRSFRRPSMILIGYGDLVAQGRSASDEWGVIAVAPHQHRVGMES